MYAAEMFQTPPLLPSWTEYIYLAVNSLPEAEPECWDEDSRINQSRDRDIKGIPSILLMMHAGLYSLQCVQSSMWTVTVIGKMVKGNRIYSR